MDYIQLISDITASCVDSLKMLVKNADVDRTYKMQVLEQPSVQKYIVSYKKKRYTATGYRNNISVGDYVMVCVPCGNWDELFII